jgi:hypothetical protein
MVVRLSTLRTGRPLTPSNISGTHFCYRLVNPRVIMRLEELGKLKKCNYLIEIRTRYLPVCSIEPQL